MSNVITNMTTAFYGKFTAETDGVHNDFYTLLTGRLFENEAPPNTPYPYATYQIISSPKEKTFSEEYRNTILQMDIYSSTVLSATEIKNLYYLASSLYDECSLTISGSTLVWCKETSVDFLTEEAVTKEGTTTIKRCSIDFEIKTSLN